MPVVNPGIRRFLGSAIQRLFNSSSFLAELTHTVIPERSNGETATFIRASTATFTDWEGVLRTVPSGCARFEGARMVRNLLTFTEDFSNAVWAFPVFGTGAGSKTPNYAEAPDGTLTACRVELSLGASGFAMFRCNGASLNSNALHSCWLKSNTGVAQQLNMSFASGTAIITITDEWLRYEKLVSSASDTFDLAITTANSTRDFLIWHPQLEEVTGQADQTASEYVSVGVLSDPWHGAGVDGVEFFNTDRDGALLSPQPAYLAEGARTNLCLQSNAFNTTWTAFGTPAATQNAIGPDGATSGWTLTDNNAGASEGIFQSATLTAAAYTYSCFVKKTTTATTFPVIYANTVGNVYAMATVDTNNGVATAWSSTSLGTTAAGVSARCSSYNDDFWRVELTWTATAVQWFWYITPAATANATQSSGTFDLTATGSSVFYGAQVELGSSASTYIATTTAAVTRAADVLTYPSAGNISGTVGSAYAEAAFTNAAYLTGLAANIVGTTTAGRLIEANAANSLRCIDSATNVASKTLATPLSSSVSKVGSSWSVPYGMLVTANGEAPASQATFTSMATAGGIGIMCRNDGTTQPFGTVRNVRIWQRALSSSELQAITR